MAPSRTITLHGLKNCDSCRKALRWLTQRGLSAELSDIRADGLDPAALRRWFDDGDWTELLNRRSTTWRQLPEAEKAGLDKDSALTLVERHPTLLKRPVLEHGNRLVVGFSPATYEAVFGA